ncbi:uncharacterized protein LOC119040080 [Artibeus jamaicensis]|uniref:uncharacterized protein LOC119040080 n=1 Tax=Artibeus jamaicensis TaxID=9417 RepID=UPI00235A7560|nr:uncharacterized protein LOC119040080 [Artibeus jamaicensis]
MSLLVAGLAGWGFPSPMAMETRSSQVAVPSSLRMAEGGHPEPLMTPVPVRMTESLKQTGRNSQSVKVSSKDTLGLVEQEIRSGWASSQRKFRSRMLDSKHCAPGPSAPLPLHRSLPAAALTCPRSPWPVLHGDQVHLPGRSRSPRLLNSLRRTPERQTPFPKQPKWKSGSRMFCSPLATALTPRSKRHADPGEVGIGARWGSFHPGRSSPAIKGCTGVSAQQSHGQPAGVVSSSARQAFPHSSGFLWSMP